MEYLHIMRNNIFTIPYIKFIEKNFQNKKHVFYIIGGTTDIEFSRKDFINNKYIKYYNKKKSNMLLRKLNIVLAHLRLYLDILSKKKIIIHGLFNPLIVILLFFNPWILKRCNWIMWGGDIECCKNSKNIFEKIYTYMEKMVKKNFYQISYLTKGDYEIARKNLKVKGKAQRAIYMSPIKLEQLKMYETKLRLKNELSIQIGNSADPENNHLEMLKILEKYKNKNIKIYAPLSYGNKNYALKVKEYGEKIFGDKFIAILELYTPEKYAEYLAQIDILIFNHKKQQGLGNIFALGYLNKKIYLRSDISSWNYLTEDLKLRVYDIQRIQDEDFEIFKDNSLLGNKEKIENTIFSDTYIKKIWEENFNS